MHVIYLLRNTANGKVYIGKTEKLACERLAEHIKESSRGSDRRLCQAIRKHGSDKFLLEIIEHISEEQSSERERFWIAHFKSKDYKFGYNMTDGGEGAPGRKSREDTCRKISEAMKKRISEMSDEERKNMTKAANTAKLGQREQPGIKKSAAQKQRWDSTTEEDKKKHGAKSRDGVSETGKKRQVEGMVKAYSPERQQGTPKLVVQCPYCGKAGGRPIMHRFHFEKCKHREHLLPRS